RGFCIDAFCPRCLSLERHRLLALCDQRRNLFDSKSILHFAPEPGLRKYIRSRLPSSYTTADLSDDAFDLKLNLEQIALPDDQFDVVICSHVLEHVDDRLAIPELHRIVRPGGVLVAMVPVVEGWRSTFEDPALAHRPQDR